MFPVFGLNLASVMKLTWNIVCQAGQRTTVHITAVLFIQLFIHQHAPHWRM